MIQNGHRLHREPHTESLLGIRLNIKDLGDVVPKVMVLCQAAHHLDDGLVSTGVTFGLFVVRLDHPEVVGVTPDDSASLSSCCERWEALGCCDEGRGGGGDVSSRLLLIRWVI